MTAFKSIDWFRRLLSREERGRNSQCQSLTAAVHGNPEQTTGPGDRSHAAIIKQPKPPASSAKAKGNGGEAKSASSGKKRKSGKAGAKGKGTNPGPMLSPGVKPAAAKGRAPGRVAEAAAAKGRVSGHVAEAAVAKNRAPGSVAEAAAAKGRAPGRAAEAAASGSKLAAPARLKGDAAEAPVETVIAAADNLAAEEREQPIAAEAVPAAERIRLQPADRPKLMPLLFQPEPKGVKRRRLLSAGLVAGTLLLVGAITWGGNHYVKVNTYEVYHVYMSGKEVGIVSDPQVVDDFKLSEYRKLAEKYPGTQMVLNTEGITVKPEKAFKPASDNAGTLAKLSPLLSSHAVGMELLVDGKSIGVLKDEAEANRILDAIKSDYVPASQQEKTAGKVAILAAPLKTPTPGNNVLKKVEFVEKVEMKPVDVQPGSYSDAAALLKTLKTGDVRPRTYKVASGDTLSFIAQKFDITTKDIQKKNPDIKDDFIKEGQELNLTVLQPALTVRTVENVVETESLAYGTDVIRDPTLKEGIVKKISAGKEGKKKVTFALTKENGEVVKEELIQEQVLEKPVNEVIKRGTKVVLGEGTGNFAWPVIAATLTSGFGYRWGKLHKGVDLISSNRNILAADNGVVESTGYRYDYGNYVLINHKNGYKTMYGHMSKVNVSQGQVVEKGEKIGYMGSTGESTGVHLHFEVIKDGGVQNPLKYLNW